MGEAARLRIPHKIGAGGHTIKMLTDLLEKVKVWLKENQKDLYLTALVFLVSVASFGLGRLSAIWPEKEPIRIDQVGEIGESFQPAPELDKTGTKNNSTKRSDSPVSSNSPFRSNYVASRNGSAYHYPWCPSAKKIKEENRIWFQTEEEARKAGYKPAGNCPGLE